MAIAEKVDIFMQILVEGSTFLTGETLDAQMPDAIQLNSFTLSGPSGGRDDDDALDDDNSINQVADLFRAAGAGEMKSLPKTKKAKSRSKSDSIQLNFEKPVDSASTQLLVSYCQTLARLPGAKGRDPTKGQYDMATLLVRKSGVGQVTYLKFDFSYVTVVGYELSMGDEVPTERVQFTFKKFEMTYYPQTTAGTAGTKKVGTWSFLV
ncbi:MAG: type VI secretion system tube protein Hcp [Planctomycetota bacterium]|nr:type VI secretion system tube protein Hcp [Planctomycetota bacterium]